MERQQGDKYKAGGFGGWGTWTWLLTYKANLKANPQKCKSTRGLWSEHRFSKKSPTGQWEPRAEQPGARLCTGSGPHGLDLKWPELSPPRRLPASSCSLLQHRMWCPFCAPHPTTFPWICLPHLPHPFPHARWGATTTQLDWGQLTLPEHRQERAPIQNLRGACSAEGTTHPNWCCPWKGGKTQHSQKTRQWSSCGAYTGGLRCDSDPNPKTVEFQVLERNSTVQTRQCGELWDSLFFFFHWFSSLFHFSSIFVFLFSSWLFLFCYSYLCLYFYFLAVIFLSLTLFFFSFSSCFLINFIQFPYHSILIIAVSLFLRMSTNF